MQEEVTLALENFEPRIEVVEVVADSTNDFNTLKILIKYNVVSLDLIDELSIDVDIIK